MGILEDNDKLVALVLDKAISVLSNNYKVKELDAGEYESPITMNTQFNIKHYEIEGVGHLMTMTTSNNPMMQMATCTLTPYFKAIPLLSCDYMYTGEDKGMVLLEVYKLVEDKENATFKKYEVEYKKLLDELSELPDIPQNPCFLDELRCCVITKARVASKDEKAIDVFASVIETFCRQEKETDLLSEDAKKLQDGIIHKYADDLIDQQGFSTKMWVQDHGVDYVRKFYHEVYFGL